MGPISSEAESLLDRIEALELRSLVWGFVDGTLSYEQAVQLCPPGSTDGEAVLEELIAANLVVEIAGGASVRSRFGETVRLLVRLRQLFSGKPWESAVRLVSDFRVAVRQRRYPRRDRAASAVLADHPTLASTTLRRECWKALAVQTNLTLAGFQERSLLRLVSDTSDSATIITAGTGSGKTLAFYLPALLRLADLVRPGEHWVKALAVYPRTELLKDQFAEAYRRARDVDAPLKANGRRPIVIGALFSSTPRDASERAMKDAEWKSRAQAYVCPWMRCFHCKGELVWRSEDLRQGQERLVCSTASCGTVVTGDHLVMTRSQLQKAPPDVLFTTTEMLNQRMSDRGMRSLFGIGMSSDRRPVMALLDEVHTFTGTSGAQAALVLRRWRHLVATPITWCGLSATLREAPRFFSDLTGVAVDQVEEITPGTDEMLAEGAEYQLALRGDPTLQASVLSTTIQASMLLARTMEPQSGGRAGNYVGRRTFVFTDDLDVTNRLFDNLRDAEAYDLFGRPDNNRNPLAQLRDLSPPDPERRDREGQRWRLCEQIGRPLSDRLVVGRTSSQDSGVMFNADVIVATASLEVGYNDDQVGAVIQHKAPRTVASFLQRKGRAGRIRGMRPWLVTILSEYGRDRLVFQAFEHLFDPQLVAQSLPIRNHYVLRMQAVYAFMDWVVSIAPPSAKYGWAWDVLSRPNANENDLLTKHIRGVLTDLLRGDPTRRQSFRAHLRSALGVDEALVDTLLWTPPRAVLLEALPTLTRRLIRNWRMAIPNTPDERDVQVDYHPLPDFVPRNLFSDLSLPEVQVLIPPATTRDQPKQDALPILQTLQQLAPGRVTRRFAFERGELQHWSPIGVDGPEFDLPISAYAEKFDFLGHFEGTGDDGAPLTLPVYRPWVMQVQMARKSDLLPTSNAFQKWRCGFVPDGVGLRVEVPLRSAWSRYVVETRFFLHRFGSSVAVRRFSDGAKANVRKLRSDQIVNVRYRSPDDQPAAVGFEIDVDGFYVDFRLAQSAADVLSHLPAELRASTRQSFHRYRLLSDPLLPEAVGTLQREWLYQLLFSVAATEAVAKDRSLGDALRWVLSHDPVGRMMPVLRALFSIASDPDLDEAEEVDEIEEEEPTEAERHRKVSRLEERLRVSLEDSEVLVRLRAWADTFEKSETTELPAWLRRTLHETLAEAILQACISTAPRHASIDTLVADLEVLPANDHLRVWITETTLGGAGVIQAFAEAFASEPRALFRAIEAALAPTDLEMASQGLEQFLNLACTHPEVIATVEKLRSTTDHAQAEQMRATLFPILNAHGIQAGHAFSVSLNARLIRQGWTARWDHLILKLVSYWNAVEARLGSSIGVREFCYIALQVAEHQKDLRGLLAAAGMPAATDGHLLQVLASILWPRGIEIRQRTLQSYNPFRARRITDPALVRSLILEPDRPRISISDAAWREQLQRAFVEHGIAELMTSQGDLAALRAAIVEAIGTPFDIGYLQFYPVVERIESGPQSLRVILCIREHL